MSFNYDATNVKPTSFKIVPPGDYILRVVDTEEKTSKETGYPQVVVTFKVHGGEHEGIVIPFHYVTFQPEGERGAGMAVHFLKCIDQPWEGKFVVNHMAWRGKKIKAKVIEDEYQGKVKNKVASVDIHDETKLPPPNGSGKETLKSKNKPVEEEVPF